MTTKFQVGNLPTALCPLLAVVIPALLLACTPAEIEPVFGGPVPVTRESTPTSFPIPTETLPTGRLDGSITATPYRPLGGPTVTPYETPGGPTPTPWSEGPAEPKPTPTPVPPFPGLLYEHGGGLWRVAVDWQPELLAELMPGAVLSPDGGQALYQTEDGIWLIDLTTGQERNLTGGSGRRHCCAQWWPDRPGTVIFGSWPADGDIGPSTGFLSAVNTDGSDYTILDEEVQSNGLPGPGPGGQLIAYDRMGSAWLFSWGAGSEPLDPAAFGLSNVVRIGGPSWSPDSRRLAWTVAIQNPDWQIALAVFDLEAQKADLLHPYHNMGRGGWFPPPAWSPDGRWLAFVAEDVNLKTNGVWVVAVDGSEEIYLGPGVKPIWSPDNRWLTYAGFESPGEEPSARLVEVGSWYTIQMVLPPGATVVDWIE